MRAAAQIAVATILCAAALAGLQQKRRAIDKAGLWEAVRLKGLSTAEMVQIVGEFGVDFQMSAEDERELARLGADPKLIEAVRRNYRPPEPPPAPPQPAPEPASELTLPEGPPLTYHQVLLLLEAQVEAGLVSRLVEKRGVNFSLNRQTASELVAAGGTTALVGAIAVNQREPAPPPQPAAPPQGAIEPPPAPKQPSLYREPLRVAPAEQQKKFLRGDRPEYPVMAARMGVSGAVRMEITIGEDGKVRVIRILSGPEMLHSAAKDAVKTWVYQPTLVNGRAAEVITETEVVFRLKP